ncbi:hypothetical protein FAM09_11725 [Niastella caeni]|uniref:Uncharacterized protein n=1 Tax=Niastella caeni TaxID=2569763 RepID=A0A4S8HU72_9BACT|nr:hypothetical protein [Niastella caeni]THU39178.1 hypothetical protein FAM09_11725 [Niastella caeni]
MKKFLVTILALVYLTSTFGATLRLDCCPEKLVSIGLGISTRDNQWGEDNKGNCKDDHKQTKLGHEQKRSDAKIRVAKIVPASISTDFPEYSFQAVSTLTEAYPVNNAPPQQANIALFILHCVHRL